MESIQRAIEPLQDAILKLAPLAALLEGDQRKNVEDSLEDFRKSEAELRNRLFICQVAKSFGWEDANKMARRKAGEFDDPELAKVLEEREKKNEKAKRDKAKAEAERGTKRKFQHGNSNFRNNNSGTQNNSPLANLYTATASSSRYQGVYNQRPPPKDIKCFICEGGHYVKFCPQRKK